MLVKMPYLDVDCFNLSTVRTVSINKKKKDSELYHSAQTIPEH